MATLVLATGFEHGISDVTSFTKGNAGIRFADVLGGGTPAIVATTPRTGGYCLEISTAAALESLVWDQNTLGAPASVMVFGVGIYFPTLPTEDCRIIDIPGTTFNDFAVYHRNSDHRLVVNELGSISSGVPRASANALSAATWYWLDLRLSISGTTWTVDWAIDEVAQTQWTFTAGGTDTLHRLGLGTRSIAHTYTCRYDDLLVSRTSGDYPLGPHKVRQLTADTGGTTAEIGTVDATSRFVTNSTADATHNSANILAALTDGPPPTLGASASGVAQRTTGATNAVGVPMTSYTLAGGETISGMRIELVGWAATATASSIGLRTFNGTTETVLFAAAANGFDNSTTSPAWMCKMATAADFDTQAELDALVVRLGYSTDVSPVPGAHAIYAAVAVKQAAGAAPTTQILMMPARSA